MQNDVYQIIRIFGMKILSDTFHSILVSETRDFECCHIYIDCMNFRCMTCLKNVWITKCFDHFYHVFKRLTQTKLQIKLEIRIFHRWKMKFCGQNFSRREVLRNSSSHHHQHWGHCSALPSIDPLPLTWVQVLRLIRWSF